MKYTPTKWENKPSTATPITAERLNNIESALIHLTKTRFPDENVDHGHIIEVTRMSNYYENQSEFTAAYDWNMFRHGRYIDICLTMPDGVDPNKMRPEHITVTDSVTDDVYTFGHIKDFDNNQLLLAIPVVLEKSETYNDVVLDLVVFPKITIYWNGEDYESYQIRCTQEILYWMIKCMIDPNGKVDYESGGRPK